MRRSFVKVYLLAAMAMVFSGLLAACGNSTVTPPPNAITVSLPTATQGAAAPTATSGTTPTVAPTVPPTVTAVPATPAPQVITATPVAQSPAATAKYPGKIIFDTPDKAIFTANPDGSGKTKIADGSTPIFSPDGKRIAFVASQGDPYNARPYRATIRSMNLDGSDKQDLCTGKDNYLIQLVRWSPRDRFIAFATGPAATDAFGSVNLCSVADKKISEIKVGQAGVVFAYDWTPDGEYAIWQTRGSDNRWNMYYGDPDKGGSDATLIAKGNAPTNAGLDAPDWSFARFSPDGKTAAITGQGKVMFVSVPGQKSPLDGKSIKLENVTNFAWSPDSKGLLVAVFDQQGTATLRVADLGEAQFGKLTLIADSIVRADWTRQ